MVGGRVFGEIMMIETILGEGGVKRSGKRKFQFKFVVCVKLGSV